MFRAGISLKYPGEFEYRSSSSAATALSGRASWTPITASGGVSMNCWRHCGLDDCPRLHLSFRPWLAITEPRRDSGPAPVQPVSEFHRHPPLEAPHRREIDCQDREPNRHHPEPKDRQKPEKPAQNKQHSEQNSEQGVSGNPHFITDDINLRHASSAATWTNSGRYTAYGIGSSFHHPG